MWQFYPLQPHGLTHCTTGGILSSSHWRQYSTAHMLVTLCILHWWCYSFQTPAQILHSRLSNSHRVVVVCAHGGCVCDDGSCSYEVVVIQWMEEAKSRQYIHTRVVLNLTVKQRQDTPLAWKNILLHNGTPHIYTLYWSVNLVSLSSDISVPQVHWYSKSKLCNAWQLCWYSMATNYMLHE